METVLTFIVRPEEEEAFLTLLPADYEVRKNNTCLIGAATKDGQVCGVLWMAQEGIRLRVLHMETAESYRGCGVAAQLLEDMYAAVRQLQKPVPIIAEFNRTEQSEAFYQMLAHRREVITDVTARIFCISPQCRQESVHYQKLCKKEVGAESYWTFDESVRNAFLQRLERAEREMLKEIPEENFCKDLCFCLGTSNQIQAAVFFTRIGEKKVELSFLYVYPEAADRQLPMTLLTSAAVVFEREYGDCELYAFTEDTRVERLVRRIFTRGITYMDRIRADRVLASGLI